jgi:hypothetical protein
LNILDTEEGDTFDIAVKTGKKTNTTIYLEVQSKNIPDIHLDSLSIEIPVQLGKFITPMNYQKRELRVGDQTQYGAILAIEGDYAWVKLRNSDYREAPCCTYSLDILERVS